MHNVPDSHEDLLQSSVASLATIGKNGHPQLTEVWFYYEDGSIAMSLNSSRQKVKNLATHPHCSLLILDLEIPERYLEIRGEVKVEPDDGSFVAKVGKKYNVDMSKWDQPGEQRVIARIVPSRIRAVDMRG
jgi:PPOX class probable F420-dependent enzyme